MSGGSVLAQQFNAVIRKMTALVPISRFQSAAEVAGNGASNACFVHLRERSLARDEELHKQMEKRRFRRTITVDDESKKLPSGTYIIDSNDVGTREQAVERAEKAADKTGHKSSIVVVETDAKLKVHGLEDAD